MSRITPGTMIVAIFAVMFGLVGAYSLKRYLEVKPVDPPKPVAAARLVRLPKASTDIRPDKPLTIGDVSINPIEIGKLSEQITSGAVLPDPITDAKQVIGRILREEVKKGSAFQASMFYPEGMGPNVAERLKPGYRAVTVPIRDIGAVAGFAGPGSMVDILFRSTADDEKGIPETMVTLVESAEVLAVGQNYVPGSLGKPNITMVTLAVTAEQSKAVKVAEGRGDMSLSMRSLGGDVIANNMQAITLEGLLGVQPRQGPAAVEIYRASSRETLIFNQGRGRQVPQPPAAGNPVALPIPAQPGIVPPAAAAIDVPGNPIAAAPPGK